MRTNRCRQLRSVLTSYVDDEVSATERLVVEDHLGQCEACRRRVSREATVRQLLRGWSDDARRDGAPLSWPAAAEAPNHGSGSSLRRIAALSAAAIAMGFLMWSRGWIDAGVPLTARGQIGDNRCAGGHTHTSAELRNMSARECVQRCVDMGALYVFISQGVVYAIHNQDFVDLSRFAGQDVQLQGEVRRNLLTVSRVNPLIASRADGEPIRLPWLTPSLAADVQEIRQERTVRENNQRVSQRVVSR